MSANDGTDVRIGKVCRSLSKAGFELHYVGWDRRPESKKSINLGSAHTYIIKAATPYGKFSLFGFLRFALHVVKCLRKLRPNTVCCVDEEYSLLALPMRRLFYRYLVCDVFDALCDRHSHRSWLFRNTMRILAFLNRWGADRIIVTDLARFERFGCFRSKCAVIANYPEDPGNDIGTTSISGPISIYAAGTMSLSRGLRQLIAAVEATADVRILSAGWLYDDYASNVFTRHPLVSFYGIVTSSESLRLAAQCDAVFAFYEPNCVNNQLASPNKIYDAMSVGRPVIINEEATVSQWVVNNDVGYRVPYFDTMGLRQVLERLKKQRRVLPNYAKRTRRLFHQGFSWEMMEPRLYDVYKSLC